MQVNFIQSSGGPVDTLGKSPKVMIRILLGK